jgi:hypothetical protein
MPVAEVSAERTRFFPFLRPPLCLEVDRDDRAAQREAVARAKAHRLRMLVAGRLWWLPPLLPLAGWQLGLLWPGVVLAVVVAAVIVVLYRTARPPRDAVRDADEQIGIPIPSDLADDVLYAAEPFHQFGLWYDEADTFVPEVYQVLRKHHRWVLRLDVDFARHLHEIRKAWVDGNLDRWRSLTELLQRRAELAREVLDELTDQIRGSGSE